MFSFPWQRKSTYNSDIYALIALFFWLNKYFIALCMQIGIFHYNVREKCIFCEFEVSCVSNNIIHDIYPHF